MDQLPEPVLVHTIGRVQICDAVALSQTCVRLRGLVLHVAAVHSSVHAPRQATTLHSVLAAADQRLQTVTSGAWREALLLAAWQRQQASATEAAAPKTARMTSGPGRPNAPERLSPLLQTVLNTPDAAAAFISGATTTSASSSSSSSRDGTQGAAGTGQRGRGQSTDFGLYWQPGQDMLRKASCLVTDGRSTVLLAHSSGMAHTQVPTHAGLSATSAETTLEEQPPVTVPEQCRGENSSQAPASPAGCTPQSSRQSGFKLLHGHLPPAEMTTSLPLHQLLLNPAGQTSAPSGSSSSSSSSSWPVDFQRLASLPGLRHMLHYLRFWWCLPPGTAGADAAAAAATAADPAAGGSSGSSEVSDSSKDKQQAAVFTGARQVLLLPLPPPPGSISGLLAPWPPQMAPGSGYQRLGSASCDASSGSRGCPRLLRDALLYNEPALMVPAGPAGCIKLPHPVALDAVGLQGPQSRWWGELCHLDLSGQVLVGDDMLATTLVQCSSLKTLSLADTSAGCMTFMTWPQRGPGSTQPALSASSVSRPAAHPAALPLQEAVGALGVRMLLCASLSQGQQQSQPHQAGAAATALPSGRSGSSSSSSGAPAAGPGAAASISPFLQPAVCVLCVLDVSGCGGLSLGAAPAAKLFQAAVGAMPHLEVLLASRLNADAVFTCNTCHHSSLPAATHSAGSQPSAHGHPGTSSHPGGRHASAQHNIAHPGSTTHAVQQGTSSQSGLAAQPSQQQASCSFCRTLSGLAELDVSAAAALSVATLSRLLQTCNSLRRLGVAGCKSLGEGEGARQLEVALADMAAKQQQQQQLQGSARTESSSDSGTTCSSAACSQPDVGQCGGRAAAPSPPLSGQPVIGQGLLRLAVGWGWSAGAISSVLRGAPNLVSFTAGVGACVTDGVLAQLASSCCHLQSLSLALCTVTSSGVRAVLQGCPHLTSLQLQQCVGPFSGADITAQHRQATSQTHQQQAPASADLPKRWQLSTLQLSGPLTACTDSHMVQLLGLAPVGDNLQLGSLVPGGVRSSDDSSSNTTRGTSALSATLASSRQPSAKVSARLTDLCLVRVAGLTDGFLLQLAAAGCRLQHISLQHCSRPVGSVAASPTDSDVASAGGVRVLSFSADAVLWLIGVTCALSLRSVTLRHAVVLPQDFVASLVKKAPLVQRVVLDACDLTGGFDLEPDCYGALNVVHVARCQHTDGTGDAFDAAREMSSSEIQPEGTPQRRVRDKDLVVHMLNLRKTVHLPPS